MRQASRQAGRDGGRRPRGGPLGIAVVDEQRATTGGLASLDVAEAVAHHPAHLQVDTMRRRRIGQHARQRLATMAAIGIVMRADPHLVQARGGHDLIIHPVHEVTRRGPARDVGLVGAADQQEARLAQRRAGLRHAGQDGELGGAARRQRSALRIENRSVQHAVPIQEDGATRAQGAADSHFVGIIFNAGCETSRCHTTAQSPSVCGVMWSG